MWKRVLWLAVILCLTAVGARSGVAQEGEPAGAGRPGRAPDVTIERVSVHSDGGEANAENRTPAISGDGRYVVFESDASNLVGGDSNGVADVFVHDRETGETRRVSVSSGGTQGNASSRAPAISGGGRTVAFHSNAFNLVGGDTNNVSDIFVRDRDTGTTSRVSVHSNGTQGNDVSYDPAVSGDSRYVAFWSYAGNLVDNDSNGRADVFVRDQVMGQTFRVSQNASGIGGNGDSKYPAISGNGRYVVFESTASNLVGGDSGIYTDIYLYDIQMGGIERVSVSDDEQEAQGDSWAASVSGDGRYVAFVSFASNLVAGDTNLYPDVFVRDRHTGQTRRVNVSTDGAQVNVFEEDQAPVVAADGSVIAFKSKADNLVGGDNNNIGDVFLRDLGAGTTVRVSVTPAGVEGNDASKEPSLSGSGRHVAFSSLANNLVAGDNNGQRDIFVVDRLAEPPPPPAPAALAINYDYGAPGSYFTIVGSDYPAGEVVTVAVNGVVINTGTPFPTNSEGGFAAILRAFDADLGGYAVRASVEGESAVTGFRLLNGAPVRPREGDGFVELDVPAGIAYKNVLYMPVVFR